MSDTTATATRRDTGGGFASFAALALAVAAFLVAELRMRPPTPLDTDAPPDVFSAERAEGELRRIFRDEPRPTGSPAIAEALARLVDRFRELGFDPQVERHWTLAPSVQTAAWVENVIVRVPGTEAGPSVYVTSHLDSVPAGPGASDAAMCVAAIVETARALKAGPPLRRGVVLLITDGEEAGLLGARAHVKAHGVDDILAVVNVEARGTTGPSLMFETGPSSAWAVSAWAGASPRPVTSSLFAAVYRAMPNDTDLTVFLREGVPGLNFACIGGVQRYHTPLDSFAHVDLGSLQQHGDNVVAAVRGISSAAAPTEPSESMWHDVLAWFVIEVDESSVPVLALLVAAAGIAVCVVRWRRGRVRAGEWIVGVGAGVVSVAGTLGCVWGLGALLARTPGLSTQFVASPGGAIAAGAGAALFVASVVAVAARRWTRPEGAIAGTWFAVSALLVGVAFTAPWAAGLFLVPAAAVAVAGAIREFRRGGAVGGNVGVNVGVNDGVSGVVNGGIDGHIHGGVEACVGVAALAVIWFPLTPLLADAVGAGPMPGLGMPMVAVSLPFVVVAVALLPCLVGAGRRAGFVAAGGLALALVGSIVQLSSEPYTADAPQPLRFVWTLEESDHAHAEWKALVAGASLPAELAAAAEWGDEPERVVPWRDHRGWAAEAPSMPLRAPLIADLITQELDGSRRVRFRIVSQRGAATTVLSIEPGARLRRILVGGTPVPPETLRTDSRKPFVIACISTPPEGVAIDLDFAAGTTSAAFVADVTPGLPPGADEIARARPPHCAPIGQGDQSIVYRRLKL